ncbi:uncharacterized protein (TIGR02677 family) [Actinomycetospora cinnamomea]|uniref:Uncharacterized protein (TIGR02677 family) n=2 Tax=Actinomycetospora cinnamomea TaxID=663609 RepID=A0A2U1FGE3_9PSEU|nr:uncharacterized protein (TIGR02677 family) [Actinomycetospora cinnamomea]
MPPPHRVPADMFRFTVADHAELYSAILAAFAGANERLETALGLDAVRERLSAPGWLDPLSDDDLTAALGRLVSWQLLDVVQDNTGNYRTAADYERRNLQYSLTRRGEAAFAGVQHALATLASTGALQTAVLDAIADRLAELTTLLADPASSDRRVFTALSELEGHLDALRNNTKQFNGELQRLLRAESTDTATFSDVKAATVAYLEEFLTDLDHRAHVIAVGVARVESHGVAVLHQRALGGAELPSHHGTDPAPAWLEHRQVRWEGLQAWFRPADGSAPRVEHLHTVARRAVVTLLQALDRMTESRRRASSAVADFRELARWFAAAPTDADLHRLWALATGSAPARHAHLHHADPELVAPGTTWSQAPSVPVSALMRTSGRTERFTRTGRVRDVAALRAERAARAAAERAELEEAWRRLDTGGPVRLSALGELEHDAFARLLDLVGRAFHAAPRDGRRRAVTADGRVEIVLWAPDDAGEVVLSTPRGTLRGRDLVVDVRVAGAPQRAAAVVR